MGEQGALHAQPARLEAQHHAHHRVGQGADAPAQAVADGHTLIDELHRHGVHQRVGGHLQAADDHPHQGGLPQAHAGGQPVPGSRRHRDEQGQAHDILQGNAGMPVSKASQQGLKHDARQTAHRRHQSRLAVGEAPLQQQGGLVGHNGGKHSPEARLHGNIVIVQPPQGGPALTQFHLVHSVPSKANIFSRPVELAAYMVITRSGSSASRVSIRSPW